MEKYILKGCYQTNNKNISTKHLAISEFHDEKVAYIFLDKTKINDYYDFASIVDHISKNQKRSYSIEVDTFVLENLCVKNIIRAFVLRSNFQKAKLFNKKKENKENEFTLELINIPNELNDFTNELKIIAQAINDARNLQIMPENYCNSEFLAEYIEKDFTKEKNLKVTVLDKKAIEKEKMNLLLSVNKGSTHEPRLVIVEYNGNPSSKDKLVYVGKGITFDTGGINTKGYHMEGMKFDMSGSVIVAYAVKAIAQLKLKTNVAAIMCITDNRTDGDASLPENVYISMSGISVEVTDTDAEGRLVLADGLYYGATKLHATQLVDVATLTGTMLRVLGTTYSGIYSTCNKEWEKFEKAAKIAKEKVWRMPLHEDFHEPNTASLVADLNNYNNDEKSDCNTAAMFLKQFTNNVKYIHCDVAGTADIKGQPQGVLINTLVEYSKQ